MPTWPASLAQSPLLQGYQESPGEGLLVDQNDYGPPDVRRRGSITWEVLAVAYPLRSWAERDIFRAFIRDDLAGGSLPFTWPRPDGEGSSTAVEVRLLVEASGPAYELRPRGRGQGWTATFRLAVLP